MYTVNRTAIKNLEFGSYLLFKGTKGRDFRFDNHGNRVYICQLKEE